MRILFRALLLLVRELQRGNRYAITGVAIFLGITAALGVVSFFKKLHAHQGDEFDAHTAPAPPHDQFELPEA